MLARSKLLLIYKNIKENIKEQRDKHQKNKKRTWNQMNKLETGQESQDTERISKNHERNPSKNKKERVRTTSEDQ